MKTKELFNKTVGTPTGNEGPIFSPPMSKGYRGVIDFEMTGYTGGTSSSRLTTRLQGRLSEDQGWVDVFLDDSSDHCELSIALPRLTFQDVQLFPEMRVSITGNGFIDATLLALLGH
jgi:hypothetical protein